MKGTNVNKSKSPRAFILKEIEYENTVRIRRRLTEVGVDGMYIDSFVTFPVGSILKVRLWVIHLDQPIELESEVVSVEKGVGMEIRFLNLKPKDRAFLEMLVANLTADRPRDE